MLLAYIMLLPQTLTPHLDSSNPTAAYVHIPFCRRRCYYCDFPVSIVGDQRHGGNFTPVDRYIDVLCQEIHLTPAPPKSLATSLKTIFFGGGTPSLLTVTQLNKVLTVLATKFGIDGQAECSIEIDPGTFDLNKIKGFQNLGMNRFSLGVQAFQANLLSNCGRSHTVAEIYAAIECLEKAKVNNWSLDLISGLPDQTMLDWQRSLQQILAIAPPHLSIYDLTLEPQTAFGKRYHPGMAPLPSEITTTNMYRLAQQQLTETGYTHYEISNYAKPGYQCQHNRVYWKNQAYYGFGMGAASYIHDRRFTRPRKTQGYYDWVNSLNQSHGVSLNALPKETPLDKLLDTLMLNLRLKEGIDLSELQRQFGDEPINKILQCLKPYQMQGLVQGYRLQLKAKEHDFQHYICLVDPDGFLFSNTILADLFYYLQD